MRIALVCLALGVSLLAYVVAIHEHPMDVGNTAVVEVPASDIRMYVTFLGYETINGERYAVCEDEDGRVIRLMPEFVSLAD